MYTEHVYLPSLLFSLIHVHLSISLLSRMLASTKGQLCLLTAADDIRNLAGGKAYSSESLHILVTDTELNNEWTSKNIEPAMQAIYTYKHMYMYMYRHMCLPKVYCNAGASIIPVHVYRMCTAYVMGVCCA